VERRGVTHPGVFSEEGANKGLILARMKKSPEVIENKGREFAKSDKKSERVMMLELTAEPRRDYAAQLQRTFLVINK
jgi:hypothetical protein